MHFVSVQFWVSMVVLTGLWRSNTQQHNENVEGSITVVYPKITEASSGLVSQSKSCAVISEQMYEADH